MSLLQTTRALLTGGGKALPVPAASLPSPALFGPSITRRLSQREARRHSQAYGGTDAVDWVFDATQLYMTTAAGADFHFERDGKRMRTPDTPGGDDKYPGGEVPAGLYGLLQRPNPYMMYEDLLELLVLDLLLVGNAYWLKFRPDSDGRPLAIYRLAPSLVQARTGDRLIEAYEYQVPGEAEPLVLNPEDVVHFKLPNPHDPIYGLGVIAAAPRVYDIELALVETQASYYEKGAKLSGVLKSDRTVPEPIFRKIQRQFAALYGGSHNAYQVAILERGLDFSPIQNTAAEAQFVELTKMGRDRVFQMFRVHPSLVNGDAAKPGLLDEAQRQFDSKVMKPFLKKLGKHISSELTQAWGIDFKFDYDYVLPEKERLENATNFGSMPGVKVKEVREYLGLEPLGDERDDIVLNLPGISTADGGIADNVYNEAGGRPAKPNNTAAIPRGPLPPGAAAVPDPAAKQRLRKALESGNPGELDDLLEGIASQAVSEEDLALMEWGSEDEKALLADKFAKDEGKAYATDQVASVNVMAGALQRRLSSALDFSGIEAELELIVAEGATMTKAQRPALVEAVERAGGWQALQEAVAEAIGGASTRAFKSAQAHYTRFGIDPQGLDYRALRAFLLNRPDGPLAVSKSLRLRVTRQVAEGVRRGYSPAQILDGVEAEDFAGVRAQLKSWRTGQAETIAKTETQAAYNLAAVEGLGQADAKAVRVLDGDGDPACAKADGETWSLDKARTSLTEHPNCRRTFVPTRAS